MPRVLRLLWPALVLLSLILTPQTLRAMIRDGGIDPANLGKGDWIYVMSYTTNKLGGNIPAVTNETSLFMYYKTIGVRYVIVKAATSDLLYNGTYGRPQFTSNLVNKAHQQGILVFGYNRTYGSNIVGEIAMADYVFNQGADGFVWDGESEWESSASWIGTQGPAKAWQMCSATRSNWPNKFLAHSPFPIISFHSSFPYKEFGYWCDTVMPQIYPAGWSNVKSRPSGGINWTDVNFRNWQNSLASLPPTNINGLTVYWTNSIKPLAPANHVYGPNPPNTGVSEIPPEYVMEFVDFLAADVDAVTPGGYQGANFWRADLHGVGQFNNIKASTIGSFPGIVNNIVIDNPRAAVSGIWTSTRTFYNGTYYGATSSDTNSFGTNYLSKTQGSGAAYVEYRPNVIVQGDYDVLQWHPYRADASTNVPFQINYNGGSNTVFANQTTNAGKWSLLGRFNFAAGTNGTIRMTDAIPDAGKVAVSDGLKLVFVIPPGDASVPSAPTNLMVVSVSSNQIGLAWSDTSTNETSFIVAVGSVAGGPYTDIATLPSNSTNYTHSGLTELTDYFYVVRAVNANGDSLPSNEAGATTLPINPQPPFIVTQPQDVVLISGQPAGFGVEMTGTPPLRYQWSLNGNPISGATGSGYSIPAAGSPDVGTYSVVITNTYGYALSSNAVLALTPVATAGDNAFGQTIVPITASNAVAIAAGAWHTLALRSDGVPLAAGDAYYGQCSVPASLSGVVAVAAGGYHSLALKSDGTVSPWGNNEHGQCDVPNGLKQVVGVAAGAWHSLALKADGTVAPWGDNTWGQAILPPGLTGVVAVACGGGHNLALKENGTVAGWGRNTDADGNFAGQATVPWYLSNVVAIAAGEYHSLAVRADGTVVTWGNNSAGQCDVPADLEGVVAVAGGGEHSLALKADGTVVAWGANWNGQCNLPPGLTNVVGIAAGGEHSLLLLEGSTPPAELLNPSRKYGRFTAWQQTLYRKHYGLEFAHTPGASNWLSLPPVPGNGALIKLTDPAATNTSGFYRARQW